MVRCYYKADLGQLWISSVVVSTVTDGNISTHSLCRWMDITTSRKYYETHRYNLGVLKGYRFVH